MAPDVEVTSDVVCEVTIQASPATVFEFFTDPDKMRRWKGRDRIELDARPGGTYLCDVTGSAAAAGEFVEVDPPHRVVFTWGWEGSESVPPGSSTVDVTLTAQGDATVVRLVHRGLPARERAQHAQGWDHYLGRLRMAAGGGDPGPDPWRDA